MKIEIPKNCPCCDYPLEFVNDQLFCRNTACDAQLGKKIEHFCKTLGIKGMGAKTVEKLQILDLTELFYLDLDTVTAALGSEKVAVKLLAEIEQAKSASLEQVLPAFSIPLFGTTASAKICAAVSHVDEINYETCKAAGLGDKVTANLLNFLDTEFKTLKEFLPFSFSTNKKAVTGGTGKSVCITGKLSSFKTKAAAYTALAAAGYSVVESVTKTTDYLVDEDNKGSSKRQKADQLGIEIISNLTQFLKENTHD